MAPGSPRVGRQQFHKARSPRVNESLLASNSDGEDDLTADESDSDSQKSSPSPTKPRSRRHNTTANSSRHNKTANSSLLSSPDRLHDISTDSRSPSYKKSLTSFNTTLNSSGSYSDSPRKTGLYPRLGSEELSRSKLYPDLNGSKLYPDLNESVRNDRYQDVNKSSSNLNNSASEKASSKAKPGKSFCSDNILSIMFAFAFISIVYLLSAGRSQAEVSDNELVPFDRFMRRINNLEKDFPSQDKRLWRTVKATAKHVLNVTDPLYPTIVLMGYKSENSKVASFLADKIAFNFEKSTGLNPGGHTTNIRDYKHLSGGQQKMTLDDAFQRAFQKSGSRSLLVENLQLLSAEASLLLYSYCDGDNAPFKDVLILLTVSEVPGHTGLDISLPINVETYLADIWKKEMGRDKVDALMSRIANNIITVHKEPNDILKKLGIA